MKTKVKTWLKGALRRLIMWAVAEDFNAEVERNRASMRAQYDAMNRSHKETWDRTLAQLQALQALDVPYGRDMGKLIIISRIDGRDVVKIIDIAQNFPLREFKDLVTRTEEMYGAKPKFVDEPHGGFFREELGLPGRRDRRDRFW